MAKKKAKTEITFAWPVHNGCNEPCDAPEGPCCCGASHHLDDWIIERGKILGKSYCSQCGIRHNPDHACTPAVDPKKKKPTYDCVTVEIPGETYTQTFHEAKAQILDGGILFITGRDADDSAVTIKYYKIWSNAYTFGNCGCKED